VGARPFAQEVVCVVGVKGKGVGEQECGEEMGNWGLGRREPGSLPPCP